MIARTIAPFALACVPLAVAPLVAGSDPRYEVCADTDCTSSAVTTPAEPYALDDSLRGELARAEAASAADLAELRAGDISDRDLGIIGVTALVVILLIVIL